MLTPFLYRTFVARQENGKCDDCHIKLTVADVMVNDFNYPQGDRVYIKIARQHASISTQLLIAFELKVFAAVDYTVYTMVSSFVFYHTDIAYIFNCVFNCVLNKMTIRRLPTTSRC